MFTPRFFLAVICCAGPAAADVLTVQPEGGPSAIQAAVDLASSGDVILVPPGTYGGVEIDGKSISLLADGAPVPVLQGGVLVEKIPAGEVFVLRGLRVNAQASPGQQVAFRGRDCAGSLWIEDCTFISDHGLSGTEYGPSQGRPGVRLSNVAFSTWRDVHAYGGAGASIVDETLHYYLGRGGDGFELGTGEHALFDCIGVGAFGGSNYDEDFSSGGAGGSGVYVDEFALVSGSELTGGDGGFGGCDTLFFSCGTGGSGGDGITVGSFPNPGEVWTLGNTYSPGIAANYPLPGSPGVDVDLKYGSLRSSFQGPGRSMRVDSPVRVLQPGHLTLTGQAGERVLLLLSTDFEYSPDLGLSGVFLPAYPWTLVRLGKLPASGEKTIPFALQPIGGLASINVYLQALLVGDAGLTLTSPTALTVVDASY